MSSRGDGREGKERKGGFGKVVSNLVRMKSILKKQGGTSSSPRASKRHSTGMSTQHEQMEPATSSAAPVSQPPARRSLQYEGATKIPKAQLYEARAERLLGDYGVDIQPSEWQSAEGDVYRVEKHVRVRIHRDCHKCHTSFGSENQCPSCSHVYCTKCGRNPSRRTETEKQTSRQKREEYAREQEKAAPIAPHYGAAAPIRVTRPSKSGGQPLVHKPPRMRVRRNCHKCNTLFTSSTRACENCGHRRCDDCPKTPHKRKRYPYGYPGDEPGPNSPSYHSCHECNTKFPPNAEDGTVCAGCSHEKCQTCPRVPRVKVQPEYDADILRGISDRFEQLGLSS